MRRLYRSLVAVAFCLALACMLLGATTAWGPIAFPIRPHLGPVALTPETAAADMLNNRGKILNFQAQSRRPWDGGVLVTHHYAVSEPGQPLRPEFGYAFVELRHGGWSVYRAELQGMAGSPARVSYASADLGAALLVYGRILDPRIAAVEMTTDRGQIVREMVSNGGFTLLARDAQALQELRLLDLQGQILDRYALPEITIPVP